MTNCAATLGPLSCALEAGHREIDHPLRQVDDTVSVTETGLRLVTASLHRTRTDLLFRASTPYRVRGFANGAFVVTRETPNEVITLDETTRHDWRRTPYGRRNLPLLPV